MPNDTTDSEGGPFARVPFSVQLGLALVGLVFAVASLADIIEYQIPAVVWFVVSAGLFVRAVHLSRQS